MEYGGRVYNLRYEDAYNFDSLPIEKCKQVYGVCFCDGKLVIGLGGHKNAWGLIGGTIEKGESFEQTLRREIKEESNMEIVNFYPIGYQVVNDNTDEIYQLRYACKVKSLGPFVSDPAGSVREIALIDPHKYKEYFDWGEIGERIIKRGLEIYNLKLRH